MKIDLDNVQIVLEAIAQMLDHEVENTDASNEEKWKLKICPAIELLCDIAEDNKCFYRN